MPPWLLFYSRCVTRGLTSTTSGFLSAGFLYAILALGVVGMLFANQSIQMPAFTGWESEKLGMLVPFLFITVACGACSGFHSIVSSGTTSKQIKEESDIRRISYGGMLVEGVLAVFAMGCVAVLTMSEREAGGTPVGIFAAGAAKFFGAVGIPPTLGAEFAMLAIGHFFADHTGYMYASDPFLIEELFNWRNESELIFRYFACFGFSYAFRFSTISRCGWSLVTCLESNLAFCSERPINCSLPWLCLPLWCS